MRKGLSVVDKAKAVIGKLTPLRGHDCGSVCSAACCKGDEQTGMYLFPGESTELRTVKLENGWRLAVCNGHCEREHRPLACMIFPFFPTVDDKGKVYAEIDARAYNVCPLAQHCDEVIFDKAFIRAVKVAGKHLVRNEECLQFMRSVTQQIDEINEMRESFITEN